MHNKALTTPNPREAAYLALLISIREETFVDVALKRWRAKVKPANIDYDLAREIAYGSTRMLAALDYIAGELATHKKLNLKLRERVLLRTAIYQFCYMDRVPMYAVANETIEIAKKHCHETFVKFLNAALRRLSEDTPALPKGDTVPELSVRYSYPVFYVQELMKNYGLEKSEAIMGAGNKPGPTMFRIRSQPSKEIRESQGIELLTGTLVPMGVIRDTSLVPAIAASPEYYIQNVTPVGLLYTLATNALAPARILDLCASPGGKLLAAYDLFPEAKLFANDVSADKLKPLSENCAKYGIAATLSSTQGQDYTSDEPFDLVIVDVPCSNSGVLNKRPEARWRLSAKNIEHLEELQMQLLRQAVSLLSEGGEIWYMTCSVLKRENSHLVDKACEELNLQIRTKETFLPNLDGWDGGFSCALQKASSL